MDKKIVITCFIILFLILGFFFIPFRGGLTGYSIIRNISFLKVDILSIEPHYEKFPSCYSIIEGKIMNNGIFDADEVLIDCSVLDKDDLELGKTIGQMGVLKKMDSRPFSISVDIKCIPAVSGQKYICDASCGNCSGN